MAADYDAPRTTDDDGESAFAPLERQRNRATTSELDVDESGYDAAGQEGFGESDNIAVVIPLQESEFVCVECFLMVSRLRLHHVSKLGSVCVDCAA